jgi:hypothetical protein
LISIIRNYTTVNSPISHKYLNHGRSVPTQKCSNYNNHILNSYKFTCEPALLFALAIPCVAGDRGNYYACAKQVRAYSTSNDNDYSDHQFIPAAIYEDAFSMKKVILKDNEGKAGIYMFTNKVTADIYVGQSVDLRKRFLNYFNLSYINSRNELIISRALIKYGYSNFSLTILEYCSKSDLDVREQYYFDTLNPKYNIQKVAGGSSRGLILSEETKNKISKALKGVYPSSLFFYYFFFTCASPSTSLSKARRRQHLIIIHIVV